MFYRVLHIGVFLQHAVSNIAEKCIDSTVTINYVHSCPGSSTEWMKAAERKNCSAHKKTCGDNKPFKYHCVMNAYRNATLEICAAATSIVGHCCPEYNEYGNLIQEHYGTVCKSCPFYYYSTNVYKYAECFQYEKTEENATLFTSENNNSTTSVESTSMQNAFKNATINESTTTSPITRISALNEILICLGCISLIITVIVVSCICKHLWKQVTGLCKETLQYSELKSVGPSNYQAEICD